jgi:DNA repair photolyase
MVDRGTRAPRGRGSASNPANRFTRIEIEADTPADRVPTVYLRDDARTVISRNSSPDIPYEASVNPYRGCEHGCAYCYARTYHEYLELSAGLDFETRILVKEDAATVLRREISKPGYQVRPLDLSGVTDPYQSVERRLGITRSCLGVLAETLHPVVVVTKNAAVTRDLDLLAELARFDASMVWISITTLDAKLAARLEPRTSQPGARLQAIAELTNAGVPCGVLVAPVIPGLTDHELPRILQTAARSGALAARCIPLRLPGAVAEIFTDWLGLHTPLAKDKVLARVREMHRGRLNDPRFGTRMTGEGVRADQLHDLFRTVCRRAGLATEAPELDHRNFRPRGGKQLDLFATGEG